MEILTLLFANFIAFFGDGLVIAAGSDGLVNSIRNFVGPIVLLVCGIAALTFLFQRQIMQMVIFIIIAVVVLAIFYAPEFIRSLGSSLGNSQSGITWD